MKETDEKSQKQDKSRSIITLFPWKRWDVICATIVLNILGLAVPLLILQLYDRIIPNQSFYTLSVLTFGVAIAIVFEAVVRFSRSHLLSWLGSVFEYVTSLGAFAHLVNARFDEIVKKGSGKHIENIESISVLKEFLAGHGFLALLDIPFVLLYIGFIAYLSVKIALVPVVVLTIFVLSAVWIGRNLRKSLEQKLDVDDRRYNFIIQTLSNHHTMKSMGMEDLILRRYERLHLQCAKIEHDVNLFSAQSRDLGFMLSYLMYGAIVCVAAYEVIDSKASLGVVAACIILANRAMQPIQTATTMWTRLQHFNIAKIRLRDIFSLKHESVDKKTVTQPIQGKVSLRDVCFHHDDNPRLILDQVTVDIEPGEIASIYGINGVGKTTLAQLILGTLAPQSGKVLIDDIPISDYTFSSIHKQIAYLPSKGVLFQGSIIDNMTLYQTGPLVEEALKLSRDLGLDSWVQRLPQGYHTKVGDSLFLLLPDGIQQRICLVRTLVNHAKIIILDEANTSLDEEGDYLLHQFLLKNKGQSTVVFITHRPSIEKISDSSYELKEGQLYSRYSTSLGNRSSSEAFSFNSDGAVA